MTYDVLRVITNDHCCTNVSQILCYLCKRMWNRWNVSFLFQAYQWSITVRFCRIHTLRIKNLQSFVQLYISRYISYFMLICIVNLELISCPTVSRRTEPHARINTMNISNSTFLYFNRFFTKEFFKGRKFAIDIILKALGFYRARDALTSLTIICIRP